MDAGAKPADAAHAMTTMLRDQQRAGRFGRKVRGAEVQTNDARERKERVDNVIDPDAVAAAIIERLVAGRTLAVTTPKR
jgi:hypothetical protein